MCRRTGGRVLPAGAIGFIRAARAMMHLVVGEDGEVELALRRLDVSSLQEEDERIVEGRGGGVALGCRERRVVLVSLVVAVTENLLDGDAALHHVSERERLQDLCGSVGVVGHLGRTQ